MKIVINTTYGGFRIPDEVCKILNCSRYGWGYEGEDWRKEPALIDWAEKNKDGNLAVVDIPEDATDWTITEYDGLESVIYVLDGKIQYL